MPTLRSERKSGHLPRHQHELSKCHALTKHIYISMFDEFDNDSWPPEAEKMYERIEELGRGSYGVVWMGRRKVPPVDEYDDEYVALKNIEIKAKKSYSYASREISILREMRHPCVIRLIRAFPIYEESSQLVALQLARGPDLQYLVSNRGALGLPLARLVARQLVAAVSYLHGRAVIHRDVKPTNCILENTQVNPAQQKPCYDWLGDDLIWSDSAEAEKIVATNKWKLMLVDFGFARALEDDELGHDKKHGRNSIVNESLCMEEVARIAALELEQEQIEKTAKDLRNDVESTDIGEVKKKRLSLVSINIKDLEDVVLDEISTDSEPETSPATPDRKSTNGNAKSKGAKTPDSIPEDSEPPPRPVSSVSDLRAQMDRQSSARKTVRAMSALGTKAYAAPEIRHDLRNKTESDINMSREALTECVADYGMIADSYSVGWTIRVILTGVPPNQTVSSYLEKMQAEEIVSSGGCFFCCGKQPEPVKKNLRDTSEIPADAAHLINSLTKRNVEERMTVREAQLHPYIRGASDEIPYELPVGDIPARHGDPVVLLKCAKSNNNE